MSGTQVSDSLALELHDGTAITAAGAGSGGWVAAGWPGPVQVEAVCAASSGTSALVYLQLQGADESDGTGKVVLGVLGPLTENSDGATYRAIAYADKAYLRVYATASGTAPSVTPTVKVREPQYKVTATTTGGVAG